MKEGKYNYIETVFLALLLILITVIFFKSPGTGDVGYWIEWIDNANTYGLVEGYKANGPQYPPLTSVILWFASKSLHFGEFTPFASIKIFISLFWLLTSFIFWIWTRDIVTVALLHLSLILSCALGYIDIFFAPTLILSMWAFKEGRLTLSTVLFSITILIKWQPIIIAPFIALYILNLTRNKNSGNIDFNKLSIQVFLPILIIIVLIFSMYGTSILEAFMGAVDSSYLSGQALNLNWLYTYYLHLFHPDVFGGLIDGQIKYIVAPPETKLVPRILFWTSYFVTLVLFYKSSKSYKNLILFSLFGYLLYFVFNPGVHENHLFSAIILSVLLLIESKKYLLSLFIIILISNINMLVFYGISGKGLPFDRVIGGVDITILLSIFNVCFILFFWLSNVLQAKNFTDAK